MFSFMSDENIFFSLTLKYTKQALLQVLIRKKTKYGSNTYIWKQLTRLLKKKMLILSVEGVIVVAVEMVKCQSGKAEHENMLMKSGK